MRSPFSKKVTEYYGNDGEKRWMSLGAFDRMARQNTGRLEGADRPQPGRQAGKKLAKNEFTMKTILNGWWMQDGRIGKDVEMMPELGNKKVSDDKDR